jgi:predicted flap endonuclease-1-like 5' DNA nuclease
MKKEDKNTAEVDETITVKIIEFNRDDKRIVVSHTRYIEDVKKKADDEVRRDRGEQVENTRRSIQTQSTKMEKTTLGELEVFSQLKDQLAKAEKGSKKVAPIEKSEEVAEVKPEKTKVAETDEKPEKTKAKGKAKSGDDLKKIEGVGPKIADILSSAGLGSFESIATETADKLKEILEAAGSRYKMHDPTSWPDQAKLAADGKWDELQELQDSLKGGKK